jgi:Polyketide cyclase / dehydrase and lipid transport
VSTVRVAGTVGLAPGEAFSLWTDLRRWANFVDGFGHVDRVEETWPDEGAKLVWRSVPTGRGLVTERVTASEPGARFATRILEERIVGVQTAEFAAAEGGGSEIAIQLDYELQGKGPLAKPLDLLFIRRAQRDALARTLRRFTVEAAEQAAL